ncbi:MAG: hypothetical protein AAF519_01120 [Bacteroidota bacterium]
MRKFFILYVLTFLFSYAAFGQGASTLDEIRRYLFYNEFNLEKGIAFYKKIIASGESTPTLVAYQAAAKALIAKYTWNPITKISSLKSVENLLSDAVKAESNNLEIRFLRFYIENSIPSYLGYSKNKAEDGEILKNNLNVLDQLQLDKGINDYIISYIKTIDESAPKIKAKAGI